MMGTTAVRITEVTLPAGTVTPLAKADPKRVALGFAIGSAFAGTVFVGPVPIPAAGGWLLGMGIEGAWFDLLRFGPLVNLQWNGYDAAQTPVTVYEVYRQH